MRSFGAVTEGVDDAIERAAVALRMGAAAAARAAVEPLAGVIAGTLSAVDFFDPLNIEQLVGVPAA